MGGQKQPTKDIHGFSIIDNWVKTKADPTLPHPHPASYSSHYLTRTEDLK